MSRIRRASVQTDAYQIMKEGSTYRGVIKNYARDVVLSCYDLRLGTSEEVQPQSGAHELPTLSVPYSCHQAT